MIIGVVAWMFIMGGMRVAKYIAVDNYDTVSATIDAVETSTSAKHSSSSSGRKTKTSYTVYVTYTYNNLEHKHVHLNYADNTMREGQKITILVNPSNAYDIEYNKKAILTGVWLYFTIGIVVAVGGFLGIRKIKSLV